MWQCNEFDDREAPEADTDANRERPARKGNPANPKDGAEVEVQGDTKGLCMNCDERANCLRPRPPEGIWHCEEYR